jgi:hypothetical protein
VVCGAPPPLPSRLLWVWSSLAAEAWLVVGEGGNCRVWWWWEERVMQCLVMVMPNHASGFADILSRKAVNGLVCIA